ncbi:MAG: MBL fold metallo-hydrolase [Actinobacteria bacterium]|nr:MBL fold metallo-hydrolase [Actinomycetota bacterium]
MPDTIFTYYKHALFTIESSTGIRVGTDPYDRSIKRILPDVGADIVTVSHHHFDHENISLFKGKPVVVDSTEGRSISGVSISGISTFHDEEGGRLRGKNIIFRIIVDGITFTHFGDLGHDLDREQIGKLEGIDVMMIPIGGKYTIDAAIALKLISKIEPKVAIPMHYKSSDTLLDVDTVDNFIRMAGNYKFVGPSVSISRETLPSGTEVWVMEPG